MTGREPWSIANDFGRVAGHRAKTYGNANSDVVLGTEDGNTNNTSNRSDVYRKGKFGTSAGAMCAVVVSKTSCKDRNHRILRGVIAPHQVFFFAKIMIFLDF
jgi:hypothetical protein